MKNSSTRDLQPPHVHKEPENNDRLQAPGEDTSHPASTPPAAPPPAAPNPWHKLSLTISQKLEIFTGSPKQDGSKSPAHSTGEAGAPLAGAGPGENTHSGTAEMDKILDRYLEGNRKRVHRGNSALVLKNGEEAYPAMLDAITRATKEILVEFYRIRSDSISWTFARALVRRAAQGVRVLVICDGFGALSADGEFWSYLTNNRVQVRFYSLIPPKLKKTILHRLNYRNHRKLVVVDGQVAFVGGLNIGDEFAPISDGGENWRDTGVMLKGGVVGDLVKSFGKVWRKLDKKSHTKEIEAPASNKGDLDVGTQVGAGLQAGTASFTQAPPAVPTSPTEPTTGTHRDPAAPAPAPGHITQWFNDRAAGAPDDCFVKVIEASSLQERARKAGERAYLAAINGARERIFIIHSYFVPPPSVLRALRRASRRNVDVVIITAGSTDLPLVKYASQYLFASLLKEKIRIYEWQDSVLHAKTAVVDGVWSTLGSYNLDTRSFSYNLELNVVIVNRQIGRKMEDIFREDLVRCRPVNAQRWGKRPRWQKGLEWLSYRFRKLL